MHVDMGVIFLGKPPPMGRLFDVLYRCAALPWEWDKLRHLQIHYINKMTKTSKIRKYSFKYRFLSGQNGF